MLPPPLPYPTPPDWPGGVKTADAANLAPLNRKKGETSGVTVIFTSISFKEGKRKVDCSFSSKSNETFHLVSLRPATRGTTPDTFPRNRYST